jgi:hypothetical protein
MSNTLTDQSIKRLKRQIDRLERGYQNMPRQMRSLVEQGVYDFTAPPPKPIWFKVDSEGDTPVPAYGAMIVKDATADTAAPINGRDVCEVEKCSTTNFGKPILVNGKHEATTHTGVLKAQSGPIYRVAYDTGTPAVGETWGPKPSQFTLSKNHPGFRCLGIVDADAKIMLAERVDPLPLLIKADAKILTNATGTCSVYLDTATDSTFDVTVRVGEYAPDLFADEFAVVHLNNKGEWYYHEDSKTIDGTLAGALAVGGSATMNVDPGSDTITVHDAVLKTGSADIASGKKIYAGWFKLRKRWQVIQAECP